MTIYNSVSEDFVSLVDLRQTPFAGSVGGGTVGMLRGDELAIAPFDVVLRSVAAEAENPQRPPARSEARRPGGDFFCGRAALRRRGRFCGTAKCRRTR